MKNRQKLSKCCRARVITSYFGQYSSFYRCSKCDKRCDLLVEQPESFDSAQDKSGQKCCGHCSWKKQFDCPDCTIHYLPQDKECRCPKEGHYSMYCPCKIHCSMDKDKEEGIEYDADYHKKLEKWHDRFFDTDRDIYFKIRDLIRFTEAQVRQEARREGYEQGVKADKRTVEEIVDYTVRETFKKLRAKYLSKEGGTE